VTATFIGVHDHDHRLPDLSEGGMGDALAEVRGLLEAGRTLQADRAPEEPGPGANSVHPVEALDTQLALGFLEIREWELASRHMERGNPALHTGEAIFGVLSLLLPDFAPLAERVEAATARMEAIPGFLSDARSLVRDAPAPWTERALRECLGARALFGDGLGLFARESGGVDAAFLRAAERARAAFEVHHRHLGEALASALPGRSVACGEEALARVLAKAHFLEMGPDVLAEHSLAELGEAHRRALARARESGAATPGEALAPLAALHPTLDGYYARYQELWDRVEETAVAQDLLTWPDFPIRYRPRPTWIREAAPHLYFLFYRSPAAVGRPPVHDYWVTPIEPSMPREEQERLLEATNDSVIKLNHVIHHGSIGHHVQNWHAFQAPSRVGRIAAVDGASRIAMLCGGTMAEGWACYATDLMGEAGFLTPLEQHAEEVGRTRMCARAVVDVRLHQGRFTLDQAEAFYREKAGMAAPAARAEAVKNSMFPGSAVMYLAGRDAIHALRGRLRRLGGHRFSLKAFHDRFLSFGSIPVTLVAREMLREATTTREATRAP
jgi:hypothetical protein